jgi:hypothetical protein
MGTAELQMIYHAYHARRPAHPYAGEALSGEVARRVGVQISHKSGQRGPP